MSDQQLRLFNESGSPSQRSRYFSSKEKVLGQFFTPPAVARFMVAWAKLAGIPKGVAVDPACGDGIFLKELVAAGFKRIVGVDVDGDVLQRVAKEKDLSPLVELHQTDGLTIPLEDFADFVVGNPPFSAKYGRVKDRSILDRFVLGRGRPSQAPEVLFLEKFVRIAKPEGLIAIILPEGIFAALPMQPVRDYILSHLLPLAVVSLSRRFFPAKTSILIARKACEVETRSNCSVFLAMAEEEGDLDRFLQLYHASRSGRLGSGDLAEIERALWKPLGVIKIKKNMSVRFHFPMPEVLEEIDPSIPLVPLSQLLADIRTGRTEYGPHRQFAPSGIRWIGASVITPLGLDFGREERFILPGSLMDKRTAYTQVGDVLFVRVGVGCAGRVAVVLNEEERGIADDYVYILRLKEGLLPEYFALYAATKFFKVQLERLKRGVGTVNIPQTSLKTVRVAVLPLPLQRQFAKVYRRLHQQYLAASTQKARQEVMASFERTIAELEALLQGGKAYGRTDSG